MRYGLGIIILGLTVPGPVTTFILKCHKLRLRYGYIPVWSVQKPKIGNGLASEFRYGKKRGYGGEEQGRCQWVELEEGGQGE